jgi:murein DD-endopeptidase MepM/ murein hydrolase activator NlpD
MSLAVALWGLLLGGPPDPAAVAAARMGRERARLVFLQAKESEVRRTIAHLRRTIADRRTTLSELAEAEDANVEAEAEARAQLAEVERALEAAKRRSGRRASAVLQLRRNGMEAYLPEAFDPERRRMQDRFRFVLAHDARVARRIRDLRAERASAVVAVEKAGRRLARQRAQLEAEAGSLAMEQAELAALAEGLGVERRRSRALTRLLAEAARPVRLRPPSEPPPPLGPGGFASNRGRLAWPAEGRVEVPFGHVVHPRTGVVFEQKGWDLRAPRGTPVSAPFRARVQHAGPVAGWGRIVVLQHPPEGFTVYARLASLEVGVGEDVEAGQVLGTVGSGGSPKGAHLYFEIWVDDRPRDPARWLWGARGD